MMRHLLRHTLAFAGMALMFSCQKNSLPVNSDGELITQATDYAQEVSIVWKMDVPAGTDIMHYNDILQMTLPVGFYFTGMYEDGSLISPNRQMSITCSCVSGSGCKPYRITGTKKIEIGCIASSKCAKCEKIIKNSSKKFARLEVMIGDWAKAGLEGRGMEASQLIRAFTEKQGGNMLVNPVLSYEEVLTLPTASLSDLNDPAIKASFKRVAKELHGGHARPDDGTMAKVPVRIGDKILILYAPQDQIDKQGVFRYFHRRFFPNTYCNGCPGNCRLTLQTVDNMTFETCEGCTDGCTLHIGI